MPAYAKKISVSEEFAGKRYPDNAILCNGCGCNLADPDENKTDTAFLIYTDKKNVDENQPYDVYCEACNDRLWSRAKLV